MAFDVHQILNLVGQLGGNHQAAAQAFQGTNQVDPNQHADALQQFGIDPQQLQSGGYQQHFENQQQPDFQGYQPGQDPSSQEVQF